MDEDRLTPQLGRLIDAAKAAAGGACAPQAPGLAGGSTAGAAGTTGLADSASAVATERAEGWALLGVDGKVYSGTRLARAFDGMRAAKTEPEAAAFAVHGESGDTLLPGWGWRTGAQGIPADLPVAVKYLGRWVLVTFVEIPEA